MRGFLRLHGVAGCLGLSLAVHASAAFAGSAEPAAAPVPADVGAAAWRAESFDGRSTASGERFDMYRLTAASAELPLNSYAAVTNVATGETVVVRIIDRPAEGAAPLITLSFAAAHRLGVDLPDAPQVKVAAVAAPASAEEDLAEAGPDPAAALQCAPPPARARLALVGDGASDALRDVFRRRDAAQELLVTWVEDAPEPLFGL